MALSPMERRMRIMKLAERDEEFRRISAELAQAEKYFEAFTLTLPEEQRNLLRSCPGMEYFRFHRMLSIICEYMRFPDETD